MGVASSQNNVVDRTMLTLAHVGFVPILTYTFTLRQYYFFTYMIIAVTFSILMHLCQISPQYGLVSDNWCLVGSGDDVRTGLSLLDYTFAYTAFPVLTTYGPDVHWIHRISILLVAFSGNELLMSVYAPAKTAALSFSVALMVINIILRILLLYYKGRHEDDDEKTCCTGSGQELQRFYRDHVNVPSLLIGVVVEALALVSYMLESDSNYVYLHSTWMFLGPIGAFFLIRGLDPRPLWRDLAFCCYPCPRYAPKYGPDAGPDDEALRPRSTRSSSSSLK